MISRRWRGRRRRAPSGGVITSYSIHYTKLYDAANFSPELIKEKLGFYPMRLTMDGSTLSLQAKEVGLFLRNNSDSTNVFWVLYGFFKPSNFDGDSGGVVDLTLYDDIRVNDIEVYMSYYRNNFV